MAMRQPRKPSIGIELGELLGAGGELLGIGAQALRHFRDLLLAVRQEFVQRRVEQANGHRPLAHDLEQRGEIAALHRQELGKRGTARLFVVGEDHLAHRLDAALVEEHVLGAAEADALGAEAHGSFRIGRRVGIGAHAELAHLVGPADQAWRTRPDNCGSIISTLPASTWPVEPSMVMRSPCLKLWLPAVMVLAA